MPAPKAIIRKLQWWLKCRFGEKFKDIGNQLGHGKQEDWTDCGIVSANTAAHELFRDEELWTVEKKQLERVAWFVKLCRAHIDDVRFLTLVRMGQDLTVFLEQIDENINDICYPTMAIVSRTYQTTKELSELRNLAHSLPYILNPVPCNGDGDVHLFRAIRGMKTLQRNNEADSDIIDTSQTTQTNPESTEGSVVDQQKLYPILLLDNGGTEKTIRQRDDGAGDSDETANSKKRTFPHEPNNDGQDQPRKVGRTTNLWSAASSPCLGESKSATWERCRNEKFLRGQIEADPHAGAQITFEEKIRHLDKNAYLFDSKHVRHLKCGKTVVMKYPFSVQNFKTHVLRCRGPPKSAKLSGGGMQPIHVFFRGTSTATTGNTKSLKVPCPGLTDKDYPDIAAYLTRTGAHGGGAPSVTIIAQELYGKKYQKLSEARKHHVKTAQQHEWHWRNDHVCGRVFATNCSKVSAVWPVAQTQMPRLKSSLPSAGQAPSTSVACLNCRSLLVYKKFKNAVRIPQPPDSHYKYVNYEYRNKQLALLYGRCIDLRAIIESTVSRAPSDSVIFI